MSCSRDSEDLLLNALVKRGINLIVPPRNNIAAGDLIIGDANGGVRRADWRSVFGFPLEPASRTSGGFRSFTFDAKSVLNVSATARVVGRVFEALGIRPGKVSGALSTSQIDTIHLGLIAPASDTLVSLDGVLDALRDGHASPTSGYADRLFYVAETVWRARGLRLDVLDRNKKALTLSADVVQELKAGSKLDFRREASGAYAYVADTALVFGVCLRQFQCDDAGTITDRAIDEHLQFRHAQEASYSFIGDDAFVELLDA